MPDKTKKVEKIEGFDRVFALVGGHGKFQLTLLLITSLQLIITTYHHIGYRFLGAVPDHWCRVDDLLETNWTIEEIKLISIPPIPHKSDNRIPETLTWSKCEYYYFNYGSLVSSSLNFEEAYAKVDFENATILPCSKWSYDQSIYESTVATDFDLVCDRRWLVASIQSSYMIGGFFGTLLFGSLSDKFIGRRNTILISTSLMIFSGFAAWLAQSYFVFIIFRFIIAMSVSACMQNSYILMMEHLDVKYRAAIGIISSLPFAIGYMLLPLYAYYLRSWRSLQFAFSVSSLILISYIWWIPSSPRWLATKGKVDKAIKCLRKIAKTNGMPDPNYMQLVEIINSCCEEEETPPSSEVETTNKESESNATNNSKDTTDAIEEQKDEIEEKKEQTFLQFATEFCKDKGTQILQNFKNLVSTPELRHRSIIFWLLFGTVAFVYYGFVFADLTPDPYLFVFLSGLMEVPAYTIIVPFVSKLGRRPTMIFSFIITAVCSAAISSISLEAEYLRIVISMIGKFFISSAFAVVYLLGAELYPTSLRTTGLAVGVLMGRTGSVISPYVADMMRSVYVDLPTIIFGVVALVGGLCSIFLPETKDLDLYDQVKEIVVSAKIQKETQTSNWKDVI